MLEELVKQFAGSGAAQEAITALTQGTDLNETQARDAVSATAEGAAQAVTEGGEGGGGLADLAGSLLGGGGGGLAGLAGSLLGGGNNTAGGLPPQLVDTVAGFVAEKTGLSLDMSKIAVNIALPKIMAHFSGGDDNNTGGDNAGGGLLGGLLG